MPRILVVDDDPVLLPAIQNLLEAQGYSVATANSGLTALIPLSDEQFQLFVLDINLPDISGIDLCRKIRSMHLYDHTPILFFSASSVPDHKDAAIASGGNLYLAKPADALQLVPMIQQFLELKSSGEG